MSDVRHQINEVPHLVFTKTLDARHRSGKGPEDI